MVLVHIEWLLLVMAALLLVLMHTEWLLLLLLLPGGRGQLQL